jgi:hypothetical protein
MVSFTSLLITLLASTAIARPDASSTPSCLSDSEALSIAKKWQAIWGTGYLTKKSQLTSLVTKDVQNFDGSFGAANVGIDALYTAATTPDPLVTNVVQIPETVFHSCDRIASRWSYTAVTTGAKGAYVLTNNFLSKHRKHSTDHISSPAPAGKHVFLEGTELIQVDLKSRLIFNVTSSADWDLLATQLGNTCNY